MRRILSLFLIYSIVFSALMISGNTEVYANGFSVNISGENLGYGFRDIFFA